MIDDEKDEECFPQLLSGLLKYYKPEDLVMAVNHALKQSFYSVPNNFIKYLKEKLR